ncbi:MAG TPA: hypothetical protein VFC31_02680 [Candidatus Limnocylindria bacterium]|nr:hypothetical protein [Candidatus Limnocylindria bacterium]
MAMLFDELDARTRDYMLTEFDAEQASAQPYRSQNVVPTAQNHVIGLIREAIADGTEVTLGQALATPHYWRPTLSYERAGKTHVREVNYVDAANSLAVTEFNTWYVRGFARRLMDEDVKICEVYRAAEPAVFPGPCRQHEGQVYEVEVIYRGHRARYWPEVDAGAFSIPYGPHCHHTIRRLRS